MRVKAVKDTAWYVDHIDMYTIPEPNSGCWIWLGYMKPNGYGQTHNEVGYPMLAHRKSYETFIGPIPDGLNVLHKCDVRCCVNPEHLFSGTQSENLLDAVKKGRQKPCVMKGADNHEAKITWSDVRRIRFMGAMALSSKEMSSPYGLHETQIQRILRNKSWFDESYEPRKVVHEE